MKKVFCSTVVFLVLLIASPLIAAENEAAIPDRPRSMRSTGPIATEVVPGEPDALRPPRFDQPLIRSAGFIGNTVRGAGGEVVGQVSQVLFEAESGQIRYMVLSAAEGEGLGAGDYLVPWRAVNTDPEGRLIALDVSADRFREAPQGLTFGSQEKAEELHRFYGVAPYWEEPREREIEIESEREQLQENSREPLLE